MAKRTPKGDVGFVENGIENANGVGVSFFALAAWVTVDAGRSLLAGATRTPARSASDGCCADGKV
ncbi:hypothetical protein [Micromonospora sp. CA-244673]|uniref:hypothetical protein n=1 Tax=Micromonospora sp. CA-244673 TaxID=3239958 RepID=UPI003D8BAEA4